MIYCTVLKYTSGYMHTREAAGRLTARFSMPSLWLQDGSIRRTKEMTRPLSDLYLHAISLVAGRIDPPDQRDDAAAV